MRPKEIENISRPFYVNDLDKKGPINRSMFHTIPSGTITTRLNIATQTRTVKD